MSQISTGKIAAAARGPALRAVAAALWIAAVMPGCGRSAPPAATPTAIAAPPTAAATAVPTAVAEPAAASVSRGAAKELVSPVALYPDPILILVLQAATLPLQVVEADRFLQRYAKDTSLQPDPEWDSSIVGLLNYPSVVGMMSESLDWTQALGDAMVGNLDGVQGGIQELRWSAYNLGALRSNDYQQVVVVDGQVRILPAKADQIALPQYDGAAMVAASQSAPAAPAAAAPAAPAAPASAPVQQVVVAPQPVAVPPVTYSEPQSSFWSNAAIFAGGAALGGLLGYLIFDDDDDDWHGGYGGYNQNWSRDINIEDSTIVVGGGRYDRDRLEQELRDRAERPGNRPGTRPPGGVSGRPVPRPLPATRPAFPASAGAAAVARPAERPVALPRPANPVAVPRPAQPVAAARPAGPAVAARPAQRPGDGAPVAKGTFADVKPAPQVQRESRRGQTSRAAQTQGAVRQAAPASRPAAAPRPALAPGGGKTQRNADRGRESRGGGGGGRGGGRAAR